MRRLVCGMLLLASAVSACKRDDKTTVKKVATTADSADQVMWKLRTTLTDRGVARADLVADTAYWFDENTRAELRVISTTFFNKDGNKDGVLTARRGTLNTRANVMEARQNVVIIGTDGRKLTSPMVRFEQFRNMIVSDSPFVLIEGETRLEGVGFETDPQMMQIKVRKLSRGTGGSITLPQAGRSQPVMRADSGTVISAPAPAPVPAPPTAPAPAAAAVKAKP